MFFVAKYPSTVATLSRRIRDVIEHYFEVSVDHADYYLLDRYLVADSSAY